MSTRALLPASFLLLFFAGILWKSGNAETFSPLTGQGQAGDPEPGTFPAQWANGVDCTTEPEIQVHAYNANFYILRQGKCSHFESPFLYLIFGRDKALLIDTGSLNNPPVAATVNGIIDNWLAQNEKSSIDLIVAHSHSHGDHVQGDGQFVGLPNTTLVPLSLAAVQDFFGFDPDLWPRQSLEYDLGGRVLDVFATPGHHPASLTFYDRRTQLLLTGDIVYPGHLFIFSPQSWPVFKESIHRLVRFAANNRVAWVLGCHIEMSSQPAGCYTYGTPVHPDEHVLQLKPRVLKDVLDSAQEMGDTPVCGDVQEDFVIHPVYLCGIFGGC